MNILKNRPFATFCVIFISFSVFLFDADIYVKIAVAAALGVIAVAALIISLRPRLHVKAIFALLCAAFAFLAPLSQIILFDIPRNHALSLEGDRKIDAVVTEIEYSSQGHSEYIVEIGRIDSNSISCKSRLVCGFDACLEEGDRIYALADVSPSDRGLAGYAGSHGEDMYIQLYVYGEEYIERISTGNVNVQILLGRFKDSVSEYLRAVFGDGAGLAKGVLTGDTSDIDSIVLRDFRRSGLTHMLAVSGMHLMIIIGALEYLLEKFSVKKGIRCLLLSVATLFLLALSGFSMSACRSAIMLFAVYLNYLFVKEHDSITALFLAVSFIVFIFPAAIKDIGLWLSFLATLGILTVWQYFSQRMMKKRKKGFSGSIHHALKKIFLALLMTFICNSFISVIVLEVFGELSVVSPFSNLFVSPIMSAYMIFILCACFVVPLAPLANYLGVAVVGICRYFSSLDGALLSLRYGFARFIIITMSIATLVMLLISLRRKWLVILPSVIAAAALCVCVFCYSYFNTGANSGYLFEGKNEFFVITQGSSASIVDFSSGSYGSVYSALDRASDSYATEIDEYVVTHYHSRFSTTLRSILRREYIRRIWLPTPQGEDEERYAKDIVGCAKEYGVEVAIYSECEKIDLLSGAWCAVYFEGEEHGGACTVLGKGKEALCYLSPNLTYDTDTVRKMLQNSDYLIVGRHFGDGGISLADMELSRLREIYYSARESYTESVLPPGEYKIYGAKDTHTKGYFELVLN